MKVLVSVPNTGWIHKHCTFALLKLVQDPRVTVILPTNNPFENNLHLIIRDFLAGKFDYWLSFDSDNPPMNNPLEAIEHDKDIIGFPTPVWHFTEKIEGERPIYWNAYKKKGDGYTEWPEKKGLQKVDAIGTGCFLIKRKVFESDIRKGGAFTRKLYPDGVVEKGNDISFCERATELGFDIWADFDRPCMHFNELELTEVQRAFSNMYQK